MATMMRSRVTLAMMLAAAMHAAAPSPPITGRDGAVSPGTAKPSDSTYPGFTSRAATARRMPSMFATWMPMRSISAASMITALQLCA